MGCLRVPLNPKPRENEDSEGIPGVPTENFSGINGNDKLPSRDGSQITVG